MINSLSTVCGTDNQTPIIAVGEPARGAEPENGLLKAALGCATRRLKVFPVHGVVDGKCTCGKDTCVGSRTGKHPCIRNYPTLATTNPQVIRRWWLKFPHANVGVLTGGCNQLLVIDVDPRNGGIEGLAQLETDLGPLPPTLLHQSGGEDGGRHHLFQYQGGLRSRDLAPGVELKADGSYVLFPGSVHRSGHEYAVLHDLPMVLLPSSWIEFASALRYPAAKTPRPLDLSQVIPERERNRTLYRLARRLRREEGYSQQEIEAELHFLRATRCEVGTHLVTDEELRKIAKSAARLSIGVSFTPGQPQPTGDIDQILQDVWGYPWSGKGTNQRTVMLALLIIAYKAHSLTVAVSQRRLAELAGVGRTAASKAIQGLMEKGWVTLEGWNDWLKEHGNIHGTGIYSLCSPKPRNNNNQNTVTHKSRILSYLGPSIGEILVSSFPFSHDAFRWGGLGKTGWLILTLLERVSLDAIGLAQALSLTPSTVRKALKKLLRYHLVEQHGGWWSKGPGDLDAVAHMLPTAGTGVRQQAQHEQDGEMFLHRLVGFRTHRNTTLVPMDMERKPPHQIQIITNPKSTVPSLVWALTADPTMVSTVAWLVTLGMQQVELEAVAA